MMLQAYLFSVPETCKAHGQLLRDCVQLAVWGPNGGVKLAHANKARISPFIQDHGAGPVLDWIGLATLMEETATAIDSKKTLLERVAAVLLDVRDGSMMIPEEKLLSWQEVLRITKRTAKRRRIMPSNTSRAPEEVSFKVHTLPFHTRFTSQGVPL